MRLQEEPRRTIAETYPLSFDHRLLFSDMDAFRHINNGAIGRFLEEGRAAMNMLAFGENCFTDPAPGLQILFAKVTIDYIMQVNYPGSIAIRTGIERIGTSSFVHMQAAFQNGVCCALAQAVQVKAIDGRPAPLSEAERAAMAALVCANISPATDPHTR